MAAVQFQVTARLEDGSPIVTPLMIDAVCTSGLLADIQTFAAAYLTNLDPITQSQIVESRISIPVTIPGGVKTAPVALSKNQDAALLDYSLTGTTDGLGLSVPNFIPGGYVPTVPTVVDKTNANVIAWNAFALGTTATTKVTDEAGRATQAFRGGKYGNRKHRKQVARAKSAP